jgi:beta-xylosidase
MALQEIVQAAGLMHPQDITAHHIVRRVNENEVRLLANLVPQTASGALLDGRLADQHNVFKLYWPMARAESFALQNQ